MDSIWLLLHEGHLVIISLVLQLVVCDAHQKHDSQSKKRIDIVIVEDIYYICSWEALLMLFTPLQMIVMNYVQELSEMIYQQFAKNPRLLN